VLSILIITFLMLQSFDLVGLFMYDRQAVSTGEYWRLITAHFVHLSWEHTFLNVLGVLFCSLVCKKIFRVGIILELLYLSFGVSTLLWFFNPEITDYVGFSGVLYGMFLLGIWSQRKDKYMFVMLVVIVLWAMWQWQMGGAAAEEALIGGNIVGIAHIYGLLLAFIWLVLKKYYLMIRMLF
jgi:rhomboid family GlyGly-CTERM serine protease